LAEDAGLRGASIFTLDFEKTGDASRNGTVWIASSDGLREYDGYRWIRHGREQGLPSDFVRCVLVTSKGVVWVGTDQGAGVYQRGTFLRMGSESGLAGPNVRRIVEDQDGTIWFCSDSWPSADQGGGLTAFRDGHWTAYRRSEGIPSDYVIDFHRDQAGQAWAVTFAGIARFTNGGWELSLGSAKREADEWASANMAETPLDGLVCSTGRDLYFYRSSKWMLHQPRERDHEHGFGSTSDGRLLSVGAIASRRKAFMEWRSNAWTQVSADFRVPTDFVMDLREAPDGSVWTVGNDCLIRWPRRGAQWREFPRQQTPRFADRHGAVWFFEARTPNSEPPPPDRQVEGRWERLKETFDALRCRPPSEVMWGWKGSNVTRIAGDVSTTFTPKDTGLSVIHTSCADARDHVWFLGNNPQGEPVLSGHDGSQWLPPRSVPELHGTRRWPSAAASTQGAWVAGDHGPRTDARIVHVTSTGNRSGILPKASIGLFRSELYCDASDRLWYFGETGLYRWRETGEGVWEPIADLPSRQIVGCVERGDELWFACSAYLGGYSALLRYRAGQWTPFRVESLYNLSLARDGTILAGGDGRFYRVAPEPDAAPFTVSTPFEDSIHAILKDSAGSYWMAAGQSVYQFRPDRTPPETWIQGPTQLLSESAATVRAGFIERFRPRGIRADAQFRWRLDQGPWSTSPSNTTFEIPATLSTGRHRLEVAATDGGGDTDSSPATLEFDVFPMPIQNRPWFLPVAGGTVLALGLLAVAAFSARIALADYARTLENRVDQRTTRLKSEIAERTKIESRLLQSHQQLRALALRVEAIREDERTAISREVHDELGQMLSGLKMDLRWVAKRLGNDIAVQQAAPLRDRLDEAAKLADETIATVQRIATELRPGALDTLGLLDALRDEARRFENRAGIAVQLDLPPVQVPSRRARDTAFFRIFQELLTNVARHSQAAQVRVRLTHDEAGMTLEVEDDGIGITSDALDRANSLGLLGISERAAALGGRFEIHRGVPGGTIARVTIPEATPQAPLPQAESNAPLESN